MSAKLVLTLGYLGSLGALSLGTLSMTGCLVHANDDDPVLGCGTPPPTNALATTQNEILSLALAGGNIYWLDMGGIGTVSAAGGDQQELVQSTTPLFASGGTIATDGASLYWADDNDPAGTVDSVSAQGGAKTQLAAANQPVGVAIDATNLYYSTFGSSTSANGTLVQQPLNGGAPIVLATGLATVGPIAVDGTTVFWSDMLGSVSSVPIGGGAVTQLVPAQQAIPANTILDDAPAAIAVHAGRVYWTIEALTAQTPNKIASVATTGGPLSVIAQPATEPLGLAVDDTFIYWSERGPTTAGSGLGTPPTEDQGEINRALIVSDTDGGTDAVGDVQNLATGATAPVGPVLGENVLYYSSGGGASSVFQVIL